MALQDKRLTAKLKTNPNHKVTVNTTENLGHGAVRGDDHVGARSMGIPGPKGEQGDKGEQGNTGLQGIPGPVGIEWMGEYDPSTMYQQRNAVTYAGTSYIYTHGLPTMGNAPPDPIYWDVLAGAGTSGDKSYVHVQSVANTVWNINHGLGKFPSISVIDSGGSEVEGDVEYIDPDNVVVRFSAAFGGRVYCN